MDPFLFIRKKRLLALALTAGLLASGRVSAVMVTWVGTNGNSATTNWSDTNNWDQINTYTHVTPGNNSANFTWMTAVTGPGIVTVNVDGGYGTPGVGLPQSYGAFFGQSNGYHTVMIHPGITWVLQGAAVTPGVGLAVGPQPTNNNSFNNYLMPAVAYTNYTTIAGVGGTLLDDGVGLRVEGASTVAGNHYSILDLSGLGTFIMTNNMLGQNTNVNSNSFFLVNGGANSQGLIYLALTNVITLIDSFQVGYLGASSNSLPIGVYLGQSNYIYTGASNNNLIIGSLGCSGAFLSFNPALLGGPGLPTAVLTGYGGSQNVTICGNNGGVVPGSALCDFTGGRVTWAANTLTLGVSGAAGVSASGALTWDNGVITANTIMAGVQTNSAAPAIGTINIGTNAVLQVNSQLLLGAATGAPAPGTVGTINITGGTLSANTVATAGGGGAVNMTNGHWNVALTGAGGTNMIVTTFTAAGAANIINITALPPFLGGGSPLRFHLIAGSLLGASTLRLGSLPANPYTAYLDTATTPGLVDLVLTGDPLIGAPDVLSNPGFEVDAAGENSVIYGWNAYSGGGGNVLSETSTTLGNDGQNYLKVYQAYTGATNFNGIYQDNISGPGAVYSADGWACTSASDTLAGQNVAWLEVTFRDANANILALYRSAQITTNGIATGLFPKNTWFGLPVTNQYDPNTFVITNYTRALAAPPGTSFVRYQVVLQGDPAGSGGSVYFDDLTLVQTAGGPYGNWNIVWSDEFNGTSLSNVWSYDIGGGGWGDNELEYYSNFKQNVYESNGLLHIVGLNQSYGGENYTSGRIKTLGKFSFLYGRIAFRVKVPAGAGLWPACWLMPEDSVYGSWAASGEMDVMESTGALPDNVIGTIHYGGPYPDTAQSGGPSYNFIPGTSLTNFNVYLFDWTTNAISWYINGRLYETQTNWWSSSNTNNTALNPYPAPFNEPFYIIMNLAIGGAYGGAVDNGSFPADLQIDYVRLYNLTAPLQLAIAWNGNKVVLTWPSNIVCHLQAAANLSGPANWTNVAGAASPYSFVPSAAACYRLVSP